MHTPRNNLARVHSIPGLMKLFSTDLAKKRFKVLTRFCYARRGLLECPSLIGIQRRDIRVRNDQVICRVEPLILGIERLKRYQD